MSAGADLVEPALVARPLGERPAPCGCWACGPGSTMPATPLRAGEVDEVRAHLRAPARRRTSPRGGMSARRGSPGAARSRASRASTSNSRLQPDQAALLRDEAEGSDEVGPDPYRDRHAPGPNPGHDPPHDRDPEDHRARTWRSAKRVALVAHDNKKEDLLDWARFNQGTLSRHELFGTGTTGKLIAQPPRARGARGCSPDRWAATSNSARSSPRASSTSSSSSGTRSSRSRTTPT